MAGSRSPGYQPRRAAGYLLIVACSAKKKQVPGCLPAIELYDGVNFRVLRKFLDEHGWPAGLCIKVLSAKYGLIDVTDLIETYDQRFKANDATRNRSGVLRKLRSVGQPKSIFVNLGKDYLPAIEGIERLFPGRKIIYAEGGIGMKMQAMRKWLWQLPNATAQLPRVNKQRAYLYIFPDWDDYVRQPFQPDPDNSVDSKSERKYAHEVLGDGQTPYNGLLVSLAQIHTGKGALSRLDPVEGSPDDLREQMKIPQHLLLFGDCGAFSYAAANEPPFTPAEAARLYDRFGFDVGASVDHIPLPEIVERNSDGRLVRKMLSKAERLRRMELTIDNAQKFLAAHRRNRYSFIPFGVIQGIDVRSYVDCVYAYLEMGYRHIALGGLVPQSDSEILEICTAVCMAIQSRTRTMSENIWLHLFGILRPKLQPIFRTLGVSSFDSASYFRKAWLRSDQNYLAPRGDRWYSTIRIPISSSRRMRDAAEKNTIFDDDLREMERRCLAAIKQFDGGEDARQEILDSVNEYGPLLERRGEDNHFMEQHTVLLTDQPWTKCSCPICRDIGIDVVVFRGAARNKRRGLHNTWVFYHKILHGLKRSPS